MTTTRDIVQKLWNLCNILRDDGITYLQYVTELTYLLFLKMLKETETEDQLPKGYRWDILAKKEGIELLDFYKKLLLDLGSKGSGRVQAIYTNASTSFRQPRNLHSVVQAIDELDWYSAKSEGLGDLYEGLLEKNADEIKSGAGQYFTPRPLIECMVALIKPEPGERVQDPAVGTAGFLINADRYVKSLTDGYHDLSVAKQNFQKREAFYGVELVPDVQRLALMNAMLHDIEGDIVLGDTLGPTGAKLPKADVILTNPPFGTKKGGGAPTREDITYPTSNKQLVFLQHVYRGLKPGGRAAIILPDNVLFEEGAGQKGHVGAVQLGRQRSPDVHTGSNMRPYLRVANVYEDRIDLSDVMQMHFEPPEIQRYELKPGDILLNEGQSRELVGRPAMYRGELPGACFTNSLVRFQASEVVESKFALALFLYWLKSGAFTPMAQITTNIAHLGAGRFADMDFPLPPLNEQRRIVAKLESLQARSRRARESLDAVPPLLEKLRQSILAAAFRGDLTKDWRAKHPDIEPATELLKRIRVERMATTASDRSSSDQRAFDATHLPRLPETWCWSFVGEVAAVDGGLTKNGEKRNGSRNRVPLVSVAAVQLRSIDVSAVGQVGLLPEDGSRAVLEKGDILVVEGNGSLDHIGRVALWNNEVPAARHQNHIIRVRPHILPPALVLEWLASPLGRAFIIREATSASGLYNLSLSKVGRIAIPVIPIRECEEIARRLDAASAILSVERLCDSVRTQLGAVESAVLAKAFRGELVPQDPNDEPAEALLARLRAASDSPETPKRRRRRSEAAE